MDPPFKYAAAVLLSQISSGTLQAITVYKLICLVETQQLSTKECSPGTGCKTAADRTTPTLIIMSFYYLNIKNICCKRGVKKIKTYLCW